VTEGDRNISEIERNLDISKGTLARWIRESKADPAEVFPGKGHLKSKDEERPHDYSVPMTKKC